MISLIKKLLSKYPIFAVSITAGIVFVIYKNMKYIQAKYYALTDVSKEALNAGTDDAELLLVRDYYSSTATMGKLYLNGVFLCHTLEDKVQSPKVFGETCIDAGVYPVVVNFSPRFQKMMPLLLDVPQFSGIRIHNGVNISHTLGCILVGISRAGETLLGKYGDTLTSKLKSFKSIKITIQ